MEETAAVRCKEPMTLIKQSCTKCMSNQNEHSVIYKAARNIKKERKLILFFSLKLNLYINTRLMWFCMTLGVNKIVNKK